MTTKDIRKKLDLLVDEGNGKTLIDNNAIRHIGIDPQKSLVVLIIAVEKAGGEEEKKLRREIAKIVKVDLKFSGLKIQIEERRKLESITNQNVKFIIVASGKGGVGKSTISANIAYALARKGKKVAIIDTDIYGSSIPKILNIEHQYPTSNDNGKIKPFKIHNIEVISTEFFAEVGRPILWRGSMLHSMMNNFFYEVAWSKDLEFVIVDSPPGTGDATLNLRTLIPSAEVLLVTTPHLAASHVAIKAGFAAKELKHKLIGVVENMSYYTNPLSNEKEFIFGEGGGMEVADKLNTELLAQIPIEQPTHHLSLYEADETIGAIYDDLAAILLAR